MNPRLASIFHRRSIRSFRPEAVPEDLVHDLLEAAMAAPSACAKDPWHFVVLTSRERLDALAAGLTNGVFLRQAPLAIVICGEEARAHGGELSYLIQDASAAIENILLAADMLGLGACWLGLHPRLDRVAYVKKLIGAPEQITPISAIALGYPAEAPAPRTRWRAEAVHREGW